MQAVKIEDFKSACMEKKRSACILLFKIFNFKPSFVSLRGNKQKSPLPVRRIELMVVDQAQQIFLKGTTEAPFLKA